MVDTARNSGWRAMTGRDPGEEHRASTPLELLFDLCFVVAVAQAASVLHHQLSAGHVHDGVQGYLMVFFAIWWAWMNFTWFASAYDNDDLPYRLFTFVQIAGVLVLAAGITDAFTGDFAVITVGYVIMRVSMTAQWLRAAASDPPRRRTALRFATAIVVTQIGWVLRLIVAPESWRFTLYFVLVAVELLGPLWAERTGTPTTWHPTHISERYGLFTIIVLGECVLAAFVAVEASNASEGTSTDLIVIAIAGLLIVFAIWWTYFRLSAERMLETQSNLAFVWGYGHYVLFASIGALGAGIAVAVDSLASAESEGHFDLSDTATAVAVGLPVAVTMALLAWLHRLTERGTRLTHVLGYATGATCLAASLAAGAIGVAPAVAVVAAIVVTKVTVGVVASGS